MLGEAARHEGGRLLVTDTDIANPVLAFAQGLDDRIDAVADHAEHVGRAPRAQGLDENVGGGRIIGEARGGLRRDLGCSLRRAGIPGRQGGAVGHQGAGGGELDEAAAAESRMRWQRG